MKIPISGALSTKISNDAVRHSREGMKGYGWSDKSIQALSPMNQDGLVGVRTSAKYLMHQERGTKPFLMWWVNGRTVPMNSGTGGGTTFRRGGHVGEPGYVDIPGRGKVWRDQRWRHPGIQGKGFMRSGLEQAIEENRPLIKEWAASLFRGKR